MFPTLKFIEQFFNSCKTDINDYFILLNSENPAFVAPFKSSTLLYIPLDYVFLVFLGITSNYFPKQHQKIGLCDWDEFLNIILINFRLCRIKMSSIIEFQVIEFVME
jgi:hypothetical protein